MHSEILSAADWFGTGEARKELARGASLVRQHAIFEARGHLTVGEIAKGLPFVPRRYFVISEVPAEDIRGEHAHTRDAVLLVLASAEYDAADYIRAHDEFLALARARPR